MVIIQQSWTVTGYDPETVQNFGYIQIRSWAYLVLHEFLNPYIPTQVAPYIVCWSFNMPHVKLRHFSRHRTPTLTLHAVSVGYSANCVFITWKAKVLRPAYFSLVNIYHKLSNFILEIWKMKPLECVSSGNEEKCTKIISVKWDWEADMLRRVFPTLEGKLWRSE
jgi:hypothetical protein